MKLSRAIQIPEADISLRDDGIVHVDLKGEYSFNLEQLDKIIKAREELVEGRQHPLLITSPEFLIPSMEVRRKVANVDHRSNVLADAFVIKSFPQKLIAKHYMLTGSPSIPTEFFEEADEAVEWLKQFLV